jgi:hypothetical protein
VQRYEISTTLYAANLEKTSDKAYEKLNREDKARFILLEMI